MKLTSENKHLSILKPRKQVALYKVSLSNQLQEIILLTKRLILQAYRRPASLISGIVQPLLWLILFGSLFQNIPLNLFKASNNYGIFLSCGIIVFTSFTGSLNAGLPLVFDREFGFLNRLLAAPTNSRSTIILAATLFIIFITMMQNLVIMTSSFQLFNFQFSCYEISLTLLILLLITSNVSSLSIGLAFILPGHIEFLAFILIVNLPMLFASTALAPIYFMPYWLQIISKFNLLTYAIEGIRFIGLNNISNYTSCIIQISSISLNLLHIVSLLLLASFISFISVKYIIIYKIE